MELSVVVSTLNDREQLLTCLDALADRTPSSTEVIVVNGPSSDGTTGAVRERADVDVLVEISERNPNVSRNAGLGVADGDTVAFLDGEYTVEPGWYDAIERSLETGSDVVAGPITGETRTTATRIRLAPSPAGASSPSTRTTSRSIGPSSRRWTASTSTSRSTASAIVHTASPGSGFDVAWSAEMAVRSEFGADGGTPEPEWGTRYRSITYRLAKNYGPRPTVLGRTAFRAVRDGLSGIRRVVSGDVTPTDWFSDGVDVVANAAAGNRDGLRARYSDRSARRNPNGLSSRHDRAVRVYDRRVSRKRSVGHSGSNPPASVSRPKRTTAPKRPHCGRYDDARRPGVCLRDIVQRRGNRAGDETDEKSSVRSRRYSSARRTTLAIVRRPTNPSDEQHDGRPRLEGRLDRPTPRRDFRGLETRSVPSRETRTGRSGSGSTRRRRRGGSLH